MKILYKDKIIGTPYIEYNGVIPSGSVELTVKSDPKPVITESQKLISYYHVDLPNLEYVKKWKIKNLTDNELAKRSWHYQTPKRLIAPKALLDAYPSVAMKMMIRGLKIVEQNDTFIVYMNEVSPEDAALVEANQQYLTIENYPT
jgi:hypothetical protein